MVEADHCSGLRIILEGSEIMTDSDRQLIQEMANYNGQVKRLYKQHMELEKEVEKFEKYIAWSPTAKLRQSELKKAKLKGMDEIMKIVDNSKQ
jgi:uncharacterized protein YdcH (DUF465 family)